MSVQVTTILESRREKLKTINVSQATWSKVKEWYAGTRSVIAEHYPDEVNGFDEIINIKWVQSSRSASLNTRRSVSDQNNSRPLFYQQKQARTSPENDISPTQTQSKSVGSPANDAKAESAKTQLIAHLDAIIELDSTIVANNLTTTESDSIFTQIEMILDDSPLSPEFKNIIRDDLLESKKAYASEAFKACVIMLGAAIEGAMLGTLLRDDVLIFLRGQGSSAPAPIRELGLQNTNLYEMIGNDLNFENYRVCLHNLVSGLNDLGVENIQSFRNAVHPWKTIKEPEKYDTFDRSRALTYITSFEKIIDALAKWTH